MTKEEMIAKLETIDLKKDVSTLYEILDELGVTYKKTACLRCRNDLRNIALEELGSIENAAAISDFNTELNYVYLLDRTIIWRKHKLNQNTKKEIVAEFMKTGAMGVYKIVSEE